MLTVVPTLILPPSRSTFDSYCRGCLAATRPERDGPGRDGSSSWGRWCTAPHRTATGGELKPHRAQHLPTRRSIPGTGHRPTLDTVVRHRSRRRHREDHLPASGEPVVEPPAAPFIGQPHPPTPSGPWWTGLARSRVELNDRKARMWGRLGRRTWGFDGLARDDIERGGRDAGFTVTYPGAHTWTAALRCRLVVRPADAASWSVAQLLPGQGLVRRLCQGRGSGCRTPGPPAGWVDHQVMRSTGCPIPRSARGWWLGGTTPGSSANRWSSLKPATSTAPSPAALVRR